MMFLIMGVIMYMLWARAKSFWPFESDYDDIEEALDHKFVFYDDYEEEMLTLKKKLKKSDKQIKKWQKKTASATMSMKKTNETTQEQVTELGKQEFELISLTRKINEVEFKITDLYAHMSDQEKLLTETKIKNTELVQKIKKIQEWWGGNDEPWENR